MEKRRENKQKQEGGTDATWREDESRNPLRRRAVFLITTFRLCDYRFFYGSSTSTYVHTALGIGWRKPQLYATSVYSSDIQLYSYYCLVVLYLSS